MKHYLLGAFVICAILGMKQDSVRVIKYQTYERKNGDEKKVIYCLTVPKGGKLLTVSGSHEKELQISYPDSSFIYITNDANGGSNLNYDNISSLDKNVYTDKLLKDTLLLQGSQSNGRFWKESKIRHIVVGYVNASPEKKDEYDKALATLKRKR